MKMYQLLLTELCTQHTELKKMLELLGPCYELEQLIEKRRLDQFLETLKKQMQQIGNNAMLMTPGGWMKRSGGHAMLYLFKKRIHGLQTRWDLFIVNTGAGVNHHPQHATPSKTKVSPVIYKEATTLSDHFLRILFELQLPESGHSGDVLYKVLFPVLSGNFGHDKHVSPTRSPHFLESSVSATIRDMLLEGIKCSYQVSAER